jgi:hypothetical protein
MIQSERWFNKVEEAEEEIATNGEEMFLFVVFFRVGEVHFCHPRRKQPSSGGLSLLLLPQAMV